MNIVYIHGHAASPNCFTYIRRHFTNYGELLLEYSSDRGFWKNYAEMLEHLSKKDHVFFVAHSLGGVYALHLAKALASRVIGAVTISTPYGGSIEAGFFQFFVPFHPVLRDIHPFSKAIAKANLISVKHPWTNIVTTQGHRPFTIEKNDGAVTLSSMRWRRDIELVEIPLDHWQVLRSPKTVAIIDNVIKGIYVHNNADTSKNLSIVDAIDSFPRGV
jgi:pimeloyl-ACP methyl ester carboxylesterase